MGKKKKTISFHTFGCRLNQAETEQMKNQAVCAGLRVVDRGGDYIIFNSCSVTDKAQKEIERAVRAQRRNFSDSKIFVTGCGADNSMAEVATLVKNDKKEKLIPSLGKGELSALSSVRERTRANVKIQEGCNNFCSYCIVPFLRGREKSIPLRKIILEVKHLEQQGVREIILTGVNIGKYCDDNQNLASLVEAVLSQTGIQRVRLSSINPEDITEDLIGLWSKHGRLCPHFHISLQSGSATVLSRMKRKYTPEFYRELIIKMKKHIKDLMVTTDVIVGFPGETDLEFEETCDFVREINFLKVHVFRFSKRKGTVAFSMSDQVSESLKRQRSKKLREIETHSRKNILEQYVGKELDVLFEHKVGDYYHGVSSNYLKIKKEANGVKLENVVASVRVSRLEGDFLIGN